MLRDSLAQQSSSAPVVIVVQTVSLESVPTPASVPLLALAPSESALPLPIFKAPSSLSTLGLMPPTHWTSDEAGLHLALCGVAPPLPLDVLGYSSWSKLWSSYPSQSKRQLRLLSHPDQNCSCSREMGFWPNTCWPLSLSTVGLGIHEMFLIS